FGSTRYLPLAATARLLGRRVVIIGGGYDVAAMPEIGYGNMSGGVSRRLGRTLFRLANVVAAFSVSAGDEVQRNAGVASRRIRVIPLGFDPALGAAAPPFHSKRREVLTVGHINRSSLHRKGFMLTVRVAKLLTDVPFIIAGAAEPDALGLLRAEATPNVRFEGAVSVERLSELYALARVYLQPSRHEGFGAAVAEAMLHNCLPVVSRCGSLPEVVGNAGVYADATGDPQAWASAITIALDGPALGEEPRARILATFPAERRQRQLLKLLRDLQDGGFDAARS
ncbi:MAG: glycosyltransferase family 4 protein, partial [Gemmatimonadales bacterium]